MSFCTKSICRQKPTQWFFSSTKIGTFHVDRRKNGNYFQFEPSDVRCCSILSFYICDYFPRIFLCIFNNFLLCFYFRMNPLCSCSLILVVQKCMFQAGSEGGGGQVRGDPECIATITPHFEAFLKAHCCPKNGKKSSIIS